MPMHKMPYFHTKKNARITTDKIEFLIHKISQNFCNLYSKIIKFNNLKEASFSI